MSSNNTIRYVAFVASLFYSFFMYIWGIGLADIFFWINQTHCWSELPMEVLSLFCMNMWGESFGYTVFSYRILAWLLSSLSILGIYWGMLSINQRAKYWYYLCGVFILVGSGIAKCCNPDYFSSFTMSCLLVAIYQYFIHRKLLFLFGISILASLTIAMRFPNLLCIPLIFLFLLCLGNSKIEKLKNAFVFLCLSIAFTWLTLYILFDFRDPLNVIIKSFENTTSSSHDSHTLIGLLLRYAKSCLLSCITIVIGLIIYFCRKYSIAHFPYRIGLPVSLCLGVLLLYGFYHFIQGSFGWSVGFVVINAIILLYVAYKKREEGKEQSTILIFILMFCFIPSAGSDTGFFKSIILASATTPFVIIEASKFIDQRALKFFFIVGCSVSLLIFNEGVSKQTTQSSIPVLKGILMESWQSKSYEMELADIKPYYKKDRTVFYGYSSAHFLYLATGTKPLYHYGFWMEQNEPVAINKAIDAMNHNPENVLIDYMKSEQHFFTDKGLMCIAQEKYFNVYKFE